MNLKAARGWSQACEVNAAPCRADTSTCHPAARGSAMVRGLPANARTWCRWSVPALLNMLTRALRPSSRPSSLKMGSGRPETRRRYLVEVASVRSSWRWSASRIRLSTMASMHSVVAAVCAIVAAAAVPARVVPAQVSQDSPALQSGPLSGVAKNPFDRCLANYQCAFTHTLDDGSAYVYNMTQLCWDGASKASIRARFATRATDRLHATRVTGS